MNLSNVIKSTGDIFRQNTPTLLTGLGVAGLISTVVLAVKATPKAVLILEDAKTYKNYVDEVPEPLTVKETVLLTWKCYTPAALMGATTIACMIGANSINLRRNAALASVYSLTETTLKEYQAKVIETIGEKKEQALRDEIAQDRMDAQPVTSNTVIVAGGDTLCYDVLSGRYFKSDIETLRKIQNDINYSLRSEMWVTVNDLYDAMSLPHIPLGHSMGWNVDDMMTFRFSSKIADDGRPCVVVDHETKPTVEFRG